MIDGVEPQTAATSPPDVTSANQEMESLFDKISPALISVRNTRVSLLRGAATTPDHIDELRIIALSYRNSLRLLRRQLFDLEQEVGAEATRQIVEFLIKKGLVLRPEIFGDLGPDPSSQSKPLEHQS